MLDAKWRSLPGSVAHAARIFVFHLSPVFRSKFVVAARLYARAPPSHGCVSRAQRSMKWCAAEPGPCHAQIWNDPGSAVHRYALHRVREKNGQERRKRAKGGGAPIGAPSLRRARRSTTARPCAGRARLSALHRGTRQGERIRRWLSSRPALPETRLKRALPVLACLQSTALRGDQS
jgi:hypothetical protein